MPEAQVSRCNPFQWRAQVDNQHFGLSLTGKLIAKLIHDR